MDPTDKDKLPPFYLSAWSLLILQWDNLMDTDEYMKYQDLEYFPIRHVPINSATITVNRLYMDLMKKVRNLDKTGSDWSMQFKTFALPHSDK